MGLRRREKKCGLSIELDLRTHRLNKFASGGLQRFKLVFTLKTIPERAEVELLDVGNGTQIIANGEGAFAAV